MTIRIKNIGGASKMRATASAVDDDDSKYHTREEWDHLIEMSSEPTSLEGIAARTYGRSERPQPEALDPEAVYATFNEGRG